MCISTTQPRIGESRMTTGDYRMLPKFEELAYMEYKNQLLWNTVPSVSLWYSLKMCTGLTLCYAIV